jgi:hypothetical protein
MIPRVEGKKGKIAGVQAFAVFLLLLIYSAGSVQLETLHTLFHEHDELHTSELEKDPCHRAVYHHEKEGCEHKSHVTEQKKCSLCQFSFHADQWIGLNSSIRSIRFADGSKCGIILSSAADLFVQQPSRAPPVL